MGNYYDYIKGDYVVRDIIKANLNASNVYLYSQLPSYDMITECGCANFLTGYKSQNPNSSLNGVREVDITVVYSNFECILQIYNPKDLSNIETINMSKLYRKSICDYIGEEKAKQYKEDYVKFKEAKELKNTVDEIASFLVKEGFELQ